MAQSAKKSQAPKQAVWLTPEAVPFTVLSSCLQGCHRESVILGVRWMDWKAAKLEKMGGDVHYKVGAISFVVLRQAS